MFDRPRQSYTPSVPKLGINSSNKDTPNVKKRHRRAKSGGVKNTDPNNGDGEFGRPHCGLGLITRTWVLLKTVNFPEPKIWSGRGAGGMPSGNVFKKEQNLCNLVHFKSSFTCLEHFF